jgi:hypothetical protein
MRSKLIAIVILIASLINGCGGDNSEPSAFTVGTARVTEITLTDPILPIGSTTAISVSFSYPLELNQFDAVILRIRLPREVKYVKDSSKLTPTLITSIIAPFSIEPDLVTDCVNGDQLLAYNFNGDVLFGGQHLIDLFFTRLVFEVRGVGQGSAAHILANASIDNTYERPNATTYLSLWWSGDGK